MLPPLGGLTVRLEEARFALAGLCPLARLDCLTALDFFCDLPFVASLEPLPFLRFEACVTATPSC